MRISLLFLVCLTSGCATLFAGGPDKVPVNSTPPGARVIVDGQEVGTTPMVVTLDRENNQGNIRVEAPGYQPATTVRSKSFNTMAILNCANVLFWGIDLITGNVKKFNTAPVNATLTPAGYGAPGGYGQQPGYQQPPPGYQQPPPGYQQPPPGYQQPPPGYQQPPPPQGQPQPPPQGYPQPPPQGYPQPSPQ